jgi:hypothetical protein
MRALSRLKDLISSERGNVLVVGAAVMPLLLGSAAFAVDTIQLTVWKRQLQRAADSGAIAGAYAVAQGVSINSAVEEDLAANSFPPLTEEELVTQGEYDDKPTVRVQLRAAQTLPFMSIFTNRAANLTADATAAVYRGGSYCMIALDDDAKKPGIKVSGNSIVDLKCGMKTNARGTNTIDGNGSKTKIIAEPVASAGGLEAGNFPPGTTLQPNSQPQKDPLAWLPNPTVPSGCSSTEVLTVDGDVELDATELCYAGYNIKGKLTLTGTNVKMIANGGDISVQGQLIGGSVTVIMTSASGAAGSVKVTSNDAMLDLAAPTSGPYEGLLFYRDRRAGYADIKITGNSSLKLSGALYFPTADLSVSGNSDSAFTCLQMIGKKLSFNGGSASTNSCGDNKIADSFKQPIIRLIA